MDVVSRILTKVQFFLLGGILLLSGPLSGQIYDSHSLVQFETADGLSCSEVFCAMQDTLGYIWFGTEYGVTRYDGSEFVNYSLEDGLGDNAVLNIVQDSRGTIWFLSAAGKLACFHEDKIYNSRTSSILAQAKAGSFFFSMCEEENGDLWFTTDKDNPIRIDADGEVSHSPKYPRSIHGGHPRLIYENFEGNLVWVNEWGILDGEQPEAGYVKKFDRQPGFTSRFAKVKEDTYLLGSQDNELLWLENGKISKWYAPEENPIEKLIVALEYLPNGTVWAGTLDGAFCLKNGQLLGKILDGYSVSDILQDSEGNLWFTTHNQGVFLMPALNFRRLSVGDAQEAQISAAIKDSDGSFWLGGRDNILWNIDSNGELQRESRITNPEAESGLTKIIRYDPQTLLVASKSGLAIRRGEQVRSYIIGGVKDMATLDNGQVVFVSGSRVLKISPYQIDSLWDHWESPLGFKGPEARGEFLGTSTRLRGKHYEIFPMSPDSTFLSWNEGLYLLDRNLVLVSETPFPFLNSRPIAMLEGREQTTWIATRGQGVFQCRGGEQRQWDKTQGLLSNHCTGMVEDQAGNIWVGTVAGLNLIPGDGSGVVRSFTTYNGLPGNEITCLLASGDSLLIGTQRGMCWIDLGDLEVFLKPPRLFLSGLSIDGRKSPQQGLKDLVAPRSLKFDFQGITFRNQASLKYRFRSPKTENEWVGSRSSSWEINDPGKGKQYVEAQVSLDGIRWSPVERFEFQVSGQEGSNLIWWLGLAGVVIAMLLLVLLRRRSRIEEENRPKVNFRSGGKNFALPYTEVWYLKASGDYVEVVTAEKTYLVRATLKRMESEISEITAFKRVHRSFVVNLEHVVGHDTKELVVGDHQVPVSKAHQAEIRNLLAR